MSISLIPDSAPFNPEQRAWLNGFLAGWIGLQTGASNTATIASPSATPKGSLAPVEDFPWHDAALSLGERLALAEGKPVDRRLMAAMAQLDCGACGYLCQTYSEAIARGEEYRLTLCSPGGSDTAKTLKKILKDASGSSSKNGAVGTNGSVGTNGHPAVFKSEPAPASPSWSRSNPYVARLAESRNLNHPSSEKRTHHIEIDLGLDGPTYEAGDALGLYPTNCAELVESLIESLDASGDERVQSRSGLMPLRYILRSDRCLTTPGEALVALMAKSARSSKEADSLHALIDDDEAIQGWDVYDLLREYPSARPSPNDFVAALGEIRPRLYSISSSPRRHQGRVHLTVGRVVYERNGRTRKGVASTMLADRLSPGDSLRVFFHQSHSFRLPDDPSAPVIMVGPGTGIAPFRAFLHERDAVGATGKNWLFFGDQRRSHDFLYEDELTGFLESGLLTRLDTAFSRDGDRKVYVQHRMAEAAKELYDWLEKGAYFYVCGDAKRMAVDVDKALRQVVIERSGRSESDAGAYVAELTKQGRYRRDVY